MKSSNLFIHPRQGKKKLSTKIYAKTTRWRPTTQQMKNAVEHHFNVIICRWCIAHIQLALKRKKTHKAQTYLFHFLPAWNVLNESLRGCILWLCKFRSKRAHISLRFHSTFVIIAIILWKCARETVKCMRMYWKLHFICVSLARRNR